jgi:hypothetical protein
MSAASPRNGSVLGRFRAGRLVVHEHGAETPSPLAARELQAALGVDDAAREQERRFSPEKIRVLEEERAPFWKLDLEALVDGHLWLVGLDLAEVRVVGEVEHHTVAQHELRIEADVILGVLVEARAARERLVEHVVAAHERERNELDISARRDVAHARERRGLVQPAVDRLRVRRPMGLLAEPRNLALELDSPRLLAGLREAHGPERNGHQHDVARVGQRCVGVPDGFVGFLEVAAACLRPARVPLHADRARAECVRRAHVIEGVDQQPTLSSSSMFSRGARFARTLAGSASNATNTA